MLNTREEMRRALSPLVGVYVASALSQDIPEDGRVYVVMVLDRGELVRADGVRGLVPPQGAVVDVLDSWSLLVDRAMFGEAQVALVGLQGACSGQGEWKVYSTPWLKLVQITDAPAIDADPPLADAGVRMSGDPWPMPAYEIPAYGQAFAWTPPAQGVIGRLRTWLALKLAPWMGELDGPKGGS